MYVEPEDGAAAERLARYIMRPPISLERMEWDCAGEVRFLAKPGHDSGTEHRGDPAETIDTAELLARCARGVPKEVPSPSTTADSMPYCGFPSIVGRWRSHGALDLVST